VPPASGTCNPSKFLQNVSKYIPIYTVACIFAGTAVRTSDSKCKVTKMIVINILCVSGFVPVVSFGAETWTMTKKEEQDLLGFEKKIFRKIYGPKYENGEWRTRTNRELEEMSKGENIVKRIKGQRISWLGHLERMEENRMPKMIFSQELEEMNKGENIVKWIKGQRISWLGHLERMEENRMPKNIFSQELEGSRRRGRPRKRWKEKVERDLQVLGVRRWIELAIDRKNGGILFDRPKPTAGCSANGRRKVSGFVSSKRKPEVQKATPYSSKNSNIKQGVYLENLQFLGWLLVSYKQDVLRHHLKVLKA
jgi:hypothetical protein